MSVRFTRALFTLLGTLGIVLASTPFGALADDDAPAADPGVARLSVLRGDVAVKRADSGDTVAAAINAPLSEGDYLSTQDDSHAEVQFDYGTSVRIDADTQVRFTRLDPQDHQLEVAAGTVDVRVFRGLDANVQIETPQATIRPDASGSTIVSVDDDGNAQVTVRSGSADVLTSAGTQTLAAGTSVEITGDSDAARARTIAAISYGSFDSWIASRDRAFESVADYRYVDAGMVGAQDLYGNGTWMDYPQYGRVWVPAVAAGWAPYRDGRWVWEPYYGWTWVDREPWGWAPFHYGNWFYAAGTGWAWYPGTLAVAHPYVYRPALVAFFNFGGGTGVSVGFGNVGWVPIAPDEPFHPWWHGRDGGNTTIVNNTTIINNYTITKVYRNSNVPGGAMGVSNGSFTNGNFRNVRVLESDELAHAEPVRGVVPIVPTTHNLGFGNHASTTPLAPVARFGAFRSPAARPVPAFEREREAVTVTATQAYPAHAASITRPVESERALPATDAPAYRAHEEARPVRASGNPFDRFGNATPQSQPQTQPQLQTQPQPQPQATSAAGVARPSKPVRVRRPRPRPTPTP